MMYVYDFLVQSHGGTNFGRTVGGSIHYDAPQDEYGNIVQPKWGHLNELHGALKPMEEALTSGNVSETDLGNSVKVWLKLICKAVKEIDESQIFHNLEAQHRYLTWRAEKVVHKFQEAWKRYNKRLQEEYEEEMERVLCAFHVFLCVLYETLLPLTTLQAQ
ncbi:hypothetical protein JHK86_018900 [Glycine max]|nr:hypothetical protein JHK86_018900 [Glycine max]